LQHFHQVTAIDRDRDALTFARAYVPAAALVHADFSEPLLVRPAGAAIVADVLGQAADPWLVLWQLRHHLTPEAAVVVAEVRSRLVQEIQAPQRRAFTPRSLASLLVRAGYRVSDPACDEGSFAVYRARRTEDDPAEALVLGEEAFRQQNLGRALDHYRRATSSTAVQVRLEAALGEAQVYITLGDPEAALGALVTACGLGVGDGRAPAVMARLALSAGHTGEALELAIRAQRSDPLEPLAARAVAMALEAAKAPEAVSAWRTAARLWPDDAGVAARYARLVAQRGDYARAISTLERLRAYGDDLGTGFQVTYARLILLQGRRSEALAVARLARAQAPQAAEAIELCRELEEEGLPLTSPKPPRAIARRPTEVVPHLNSRCGLSPDRPTGRSSKQLQPPKKTGSEL
jgi:tetratricopeptide (TPR) repeat protein